MADLNGRDVNGMRAAPWPKIDTSAISKVKVSSKCTNEELNNAVSQMLVSAVDALYGDSKDYKYIKIVDMIMLRIRGALSQLNDQIQKQNAEALNSSTIVSEMSESLSELIQKSSKKSDEQHLNAVKKIYDAIIQKIQQLSDKIDKISSSSEESGSLNSSAKNLTKDRYAELFSIDAEKQDARIAQQAEMSERTFQLLTDLQKQITQSFSKIQQMISSAAV